ncbi:aldehyde dehydrogenase family protein [Paenalcaligenes sp. Me52]|uniref:aldehyde dehydrogenase family protein n=1 Tax=Paenalcaligenes sp. Me52 TaxID=3392038 RepID=UPI003D2D488C
MLTLQKHFIQNQWVDSASSETLNLYHPATGQLHAVLTRGDASDVDKAVQAAATAFNSWKALSGTKRAQYLLTIADQLEERADILAADSVRFSGKLLAEAYLDVEDAVACFRYYAELATQLDAQQGQLRDIQAPGFQAYCYHQPLGVVALITPWNFPLVTAAWKLAPALAAGCTVVWKPSELIPLPEQHIASCVLASGLPAGVLNLVHGDGLHVGAPLCAHPLVNKISFTGSNKVGEEVMRAAAQGTRPVSLELGGKSPIIVMADSDIENACDWVCSGIFSNSGQMCSATSRLLVHSSIAPALYAALKQRAHDFVLGDPAVPTSTLAPLISAIQQKQVQAFQNQGLRDGIVDLLALVPITVPEEGFYVRPSIFLNVPSEHDLWQKEIFGPVLCVQEFDEVDQAIDLANQQHFGLAATVISADQENAHNIAQQLVSGVTWINSHQFVPAAGSWGGYKRSGIGRELGPWGLAAYQSISHIYSPV